MKILRTGILTTLFIPKFMSNMNQSNVLNNEEWPEAALAAGMVLLQKSVSEKTVIIDVGAHRGESLRSFDKNAIKSYIYIGMEPNPDAYSDFKKVADEIKSDKSEIHCLTAAVGNKDGKVKFLRTKESAVGGILPPVKGLSERVPTGDHFIQQEFEVELVTVNTLVRKFNLSSIEVLKIDTEGYDLEVLKGAVEIIEAKLPKIIITEVFFVPYRQDQAYFWDIATFMGQHGYHFVNLYDTRDTTQGRLYTGNGLWVSPEIASLNNFL
jgi:FkbM family methyltransferase